jgi:predicted DNA binding protein
MTGVRAELVFGSPSACPLASASAKTDGQLKDVSWTATHDGAVTEQFAATEDIADSDDFETVFEYDDRTIYEFDRDPDGPCLCERLEQRLGPVTETYAVDGELHITVHTGDVAGLQDYLQECTRRFGDVRIEYLVSERGETEEGDIVPVDVRRLTDRQREVIETAYEMGYFEYPRGANASEVADALDIRSSTFTEHLNAAQSKLLDELRIGTATEPNRHSDDENETSYL